MVMVEASRTSMNSWCLGQYGAEWVMIERLSTVTQWLWARYSHLNLCHMSV